MELTTPSRHSLPATDGLADDLLNAVSVVTSNLALAERHAAGNQRLIRLLENSRNAAERACDLAQRIAMANTGHGAAVLGAYEDSASFSGPQTPKRILVVEDDPLVAEVALTVLSDLGHLVTLRHDAPSALAILREVDGFDLVFSDIVMPGGMSGIEMAEQISSERPRLPILLATGYSNAALAPGALRFPVLAKPYSVQELSRRVAQMLPV